MTTTAQYSSSAVLNDTHESITKAENEIEENNNLLISIADGMNNLCEKLSRLEYVLKRKEIEQNTQAIKERQNED
jgi:hypothetical protein